MILMLSLFAPTGPAGLLAGAEKLAFTSILAGVAVLGLQVGSCTSKSYTLSQTPCCFTCIVASSNLLFPISVAFVSSSDTNGHSLRSGTLQLRCLLSLTASMHASAALLSLDDMQDMRGDADILRHCCCQDTNAICCTDTCITLFKTQSMESLLHPTKFLFHLCYTGEGLRLHTSSSP